MTIQEIEIKRAYWDRLFEKALKNFFTTQGKQITKLSRVANLKEFERRALTQIEQDKPKLKKLYTGLYNGIIQDFGRTTYNELVGKKIFSLFAFGVYSWLAATVLKQTSAISGYSALVIKNVVKHAIENGTPVLEVAKTLRTIFLERFSLVRAKRIARTEVNTASNYGSWAGAMQSGATVTKIWIPTRDKRTRPTHKKAGKHPPVALDGYFTVGKGKLKYPGDPEGPTEEVVNCRCAVGYRRVNNG